MSSAKLNYLINKLTFTNSTQNLNCSKLFKEKKPANAEAWKEVINQQPKNIDWLTNHAYTEQKKHNYQQFSRTEIQAWLEDLYYNKTYLGLSKELQVAQHLSHKHPEFKIIMDDKADTKYAVDIIIDDAASAKRIGAIQVKSDTYQHSQLNENKNQEFKRVYPEVKQVFYLLYNKETGWLNNPELNHYLRQLTD